MMAEPAPGPAYRPQLQRRLMLAFAGYTLLVGTLLGALSMLFVYAVEDAFFTATLRAEVARQQAHHRAQGRYTAPALPYLRLYARGDRLPADLAPQLAAQPQRHEFTGSEGRHYHLHRLDADGTLLVAEVGEQLVVRPLRNELLRWLLGASAGLTVLALLLGWALARRTSAPLATLARRVAGSAPDALPDDLSRGLAHDEVGQLARHLDLLHARTRDFIAREQAFTADASHELRTPLAVLTIACERLQQQATDAQRPLVQSMQAAIWQLGQTVALMLALARESPDDTADTAARPLLPMLEQLLLAHAPLLDQHGLQLDLDVPAGLTRPWSPALTQLLVGNLLANAIAHSHAQAGPHDQTLAPQIRIVADATRLQVCNASPAPPAALLAVGGAGRERGIKGATSSGHGLGLPIVRRLAQRHGLALELGHHEGWTVATLRTPEVLDAPVPVAAGG
jgi:signal transduction histidine kinase